MTNWLKKARFFLSGGARPSDAAARLRILLTVEALEARYLPALTITPTFDSSITSDANATAIENTINSAISYYESVFSNPINVAITFKEGGGLGQSDYTLYSVNYADFRAALVAENLAQPTPDTTTALAHLPNQTSNPVPGAADNQVFINTANLRALGFSGNDFPAPGGVDGTILLNTTLTTPGSPNSSNSYSLFAVVQHEIDEVLGLGSAIDAFPDPMPEDLYRYDPSGNRNWTDQGDNAFFSLDGTTDLVQFNQTPPGDFGDWWSPGGNSGTNPPPRVQDAFASPGKTPTLATDAGQVEVRALNVIGYTFAAPTVTSVLVNGSSSATQRSMVTSLVVNFSEPVSLDANAFSLALHPNVTVDGVSGQTVGSLPATLNVTPASGSNVSYTITFSDPSNVVGGSIANGVYDLTVHAGAVHNAANTGLGADAVSTFFRLFGDINGDGTVNNSDKLRFNQAYNNPSSPNLATFDYNADGTVNNTDKLHFNQAYNTIYSFSPAAQPSGAMNGVNGQAAGTLPATRAVTPAPGPTMSSISVVPEQSAGSASSADGGLLVSAVPFSSQSSSAIAAAAASTAFSLSGDDNGDGTVNSTDKLRFNSAFNNPSPPSLDSPDCQTDGAANDADKIFNTTLSF